MAVDLASSFSHDTRKALHLFAVWPPGDILALGQYGLLQGDRFTPLGNVSDVLKQVHVSSRPVGPKLQFNFKSTGVAEGKLKAKGSTGKSSAIGSAKVGTKLTFKKAGSTYFRAKDTAYQAIDNLGDINNAIMAAFIGGTWNPEWAVVHGVYTAAGTTIIISSESGGSIELEGTAKPDGSLDLADANAQIAGRISNKIQFEILAKPGVTPLICLSKIRPRNRLLALFGWSQKTMRPLLAATDAGSADAVHNEMIKMNADVSLDLAKELKMDPSDLFHLAELDGAPS